MSKLEIEKKFLIFRGKLVGEIVSKNCEQSRDEKGYRVDIDDSYVALSNLINWIHFGYAKSGFNGKRFSIGLFYSSIHSASRKLSLNLSHVAKISLSFRVRTHTRAEERTCLSSYANNIPMRHL